MIKYDYRDMYDLFNRLGMIEDFRDHQVMSLEDTRSSVEEDFEDSCSDLISVINFVDNLTIENDLETIKKFLVCLLYKR